MTFFKGHGHVHAVWIIALLIFVNAWNLFLLPNGGQVAEFISFAASIASLVLAVVAIFYSFVTSRSSSENVGRLAISAQQTEEAARSLSSIASEISECTKNLEARLATMEPTIAEVSGRVTDVHSMLQASSSVGGPSTPDANIEGKRFGNGAVISIILIIRAYNSKKFFDTRKVFSSQMWQAFTAGYLQSIESSSLFGISLKSDEANFSVISLGELKVDDFESRFDKIKNSEKFDLSTVIEEVENFFSAE